MFHHDKSPQMQRRIESKILNESITGCSRAPNSKVNSSSLKLQYDEDELRQSRVESPTRKHYEQDSILKEAGKTKASAPMFIGTSNQYMRDRGASPLVERPSTVVKNTRDFRSQIACLSQEASWSPEKEIYSKPHRDMDTKLYRNLLTTFETGRVVNAISKN